MRTGFLSALLFASVYAGGKEITQLGADITKPATDKAALLTADILSKGKKEEVGSSQTDTAEKKIGSTEEKLGSAEKQIGATKDVMAGSTEEKLGSAEQQIGRSKDKKIGSTEEKLGSAEKQIGATQDKTVGNMQEKAGSSGEKVGTSHEEKKAVRKETEVGSKEGMGVTKEETQPGSSDKLDYTKLFTKGLCPARVQGMKNLDYKRLSGDWFLQRTDESFIPELLPSCHHCQLDVNDFGEFQATEEVQFNGKPLILEGVQGMFTGASMEVEFFGSRMQVQFEIVDTDYDNYMIGYECFDNMQFALENKVEPVHVITMGLATRHPDETLENMTKYENRVFEVLPFLTKKDLATIKQGKSASCQYQLEF